MIAKYEKPLIGWQQKENPSDKSSRVNGNVVEKVISKLLHSYFVAHG